MALDGKTPVFNDLLAFIWCKMDIVPRDTLLEVVKNYYKYDIVLAARDVFSEHLAADNQRMKQRKTELILTAIYESMLAMKTESTLLFVALNINNLPCVDLKNIDGAALVFRQAEMKVVVDGLQREQNIMRDQIAKLLAEVPGGVSPLELRRPVSGASGSRVVSSHTRRSSSTGTTDRDIVDIAPLPPAKSYAGAVRSVPRRQSNTGSNPPSNHVRVKKKKLPPPKTGRKEGTALNVVPHVKKTRVFISRLSPDCCVDTVKNFVEELIGDSCEVEKLQTRFPTYSSFVVICAAVHNDKIMNEDEWESGVMLRPFVGALHKSRELTSPRN